MDIAARFIALAHRDLPFLEYSREFCRLAAATALDEATILSLFWHGANFHRPWASQTPRDYAGGKGSSGVWRVSGPEPETSLPSSAAPTSPPTRPAALPCRPAEYMASQISVDRQSSPVPAPRLRSPEPLLVPSSSPEPLLVRAPAGSVPALQSASKRQLQWLLHASALQWLLHASALQWRLHASALQWLLHASALQCPRLPSASSARACRAALKCPRLPSAPQESMPPVRPLVPDGALISPKEIFWGGGK